MNTAGQAAVAATTGLAIGATSGFIIKKTVGKKNPELAEKLVIFTSGLFIGASIGVFAGPALISKSQAGAILASD
jgi:hypothetical protein